MHKLTVFVGAVAITALSVPAQQVVVPALFDGVEAGSTGNIWRNGINRYQCVWDSSHFADHDVAHPIIIHTIDFRLDGGLAGTPVTYPNVEIYVDYSANDHAVLSTTFAGNRTQPLPRTPEYAGAVNLIAASGATPNDWVVTIPLDHPFTYMPDQGLDLLVEIVILDGPSPAAGNTMSSAFNIAQHQCAAIRSVGSTTALTGSATAFCPVMRVNYTDLAGGARHSTVGEGCYKRAVSFYEEFALSANDLTGVTVTAARNGTGGYDVSSAALSTYVAPTAPGLGLGDDVVSTAIPLPFTFDYPGGSTTTIFVDSNGRIFLDASTGSSVTATPAGLLTTAVNVLCPSWQDLHPDGATNVDNVHAEANLAGTEFYITWNNVKCFPNTSPAGGANQFQVALIDNGTDDSFEFRYVAAFNDSTTNAGIMMAAWSPGNGAQDPGPSDLTGGPFSTTADIGPLTLGAAPRPVLGASVDYTLTNVRANTGFSTIFASFHGTAPTPLSAFGLLNADGCYALLHYSSAVPFSNLMMSAPTAVQSFLYPVDPIFSGAIFFLQGVELAPLENADQVITSNAVRVLVGTL